MLSSTLLVLLLGCPEIPKDDAPVDSAADTAADSGLPDRDEDGFAEDVDCDDADAEVNPGVASDGCNEVDDDCDGDVDEDPDVAWHPDADEDGYGSSSEATFACVAPAGYSFGSSDCDDSNADVWPDADELCDEVDNDCDGETDEGLPADAEFWEDADADGAGDPDSRAAACAVPTTGTYVTNGLDCDDADPANPVWVQHGAGAGAGTYASPYHKVQDALRSGIACALVGPGTYSEDLTWPAADLWLRSTDGAEATILSGSGTAPVITVADASTTGSVVDGFTISGGGGRQVSTSSVVAGITYYYTKYYGGGLAVGEGSAVSVHDSVVSNNELAVYSESSSGSLRYVTASYGGAFYVAGGTLVLDGVELRDNYAYNGGALYVTGGVVDAVNTTIGGNTAYAWASLYADAESEVSIAASLVNANQPTSSPGGLAVYDSALVLDHVDVVSHDYGVLARNSKIVVNSSIFAGNAYGVQLASSSLTAAYNAFDNDNANYGGVTDPTGTNGNLAVDCAFVLYKDDANAENDDFMLSAGSPCIDVGSPTEVDADGSRADIGAYGGSFGGW